MAEKSNNRRGVRAIGEVGPVGSPAMPLLAASAAARLAGQVLARLQSPYASAHVRAPHPVVLWREVARRMGYAPAASRIENVAPAVVGRGGAGSPFGGGGLNVPPAPQFVWRSRAVAPEVEDWEPARWVPSRPTGVVAPRVIGESVPVPLSLPMQRQDLGRGEQGVRAKASSQGAPPVFTPAVTVRVEYVPAPAVSAPSPVMVPTAVPVFNAGIVRVVQRYGIEAAAPLADVGRSLSAGVNRGLAPSTDLLSRMVRPASVEMTPAFRSDVAAPIIVNERVIEPVVAPVLALPSQSVSIPPAMPLAQTQVGRGRIAEDTEETAFEPARPQSVFGRIVERIVSVMPEGLRRFVPPQVASQAQPQRQVSEQVVSAGEGVTQVALRPLQAEAAPMQTYASVAGPGEVRETSGERVSQDALVEAGEVQPQVEHVSRRAVRSSEVVPPQVVSSQEREVVSRGPGGLLSSLWARLRGEEVERREPVGPAPLSLPWVSRSQAGASEIVEAEAFEEPDAPSPTASRYARSRVGAPVSGNVVSAPASIVTPAVSVPSLVQAQAEQSSVSSVVEQPELAMPAVPVPVEGVVAAPVMQGTDVFSHEVASQPVGDEAVASAVEPQAVPVWESLPEMAQFVAEAHAPLPEAAPIGSFAPSGLVARILARLGIVASPGAVAPQQVSSGLFETVLPRGEGAVAQNEATGFGLPAFATSTLLPVARMSSDEGASVFVSASGQSEATPARVARSVEGPRYVQNATAQRLNSMVSRLAAMTTPLTVGQLPAARAPLMGVLRSATQMLRIAQDSSEVEDREGLAGAEDYLTLLNQLYGDGATAVQRPLAVPYAGFAAPGERQSYFEYERVGNGETGSLFDYSSDGDTGGFEDGADDADPMTLAARELAIRSSMRAAGDGVGVLTNYSWGEADESPAAVAEAGMWANVIASAAGGPVAAGSNSMALALAGAERSAPDGEQRPPNEDRSQGPNLDDLADTIYSIIRQRLAIEQERNFT